jgi:hypothetical protein
MKGATECRAVILNRCNKTEGNLNANRDHPLPKFKAYPAENLGHQFRSFYITQEPFPYFGRQDEMVWHVILEGLI